jgi:hypothetical protein
MRLIAAVAMLIALGACGDDYSLRVRVEHPEAAMIERTVVTIYESPMDEVRCTDIEFQDVSETVLAGLEVTRYEEGGPDGPQGSIENVSREGLKLVVARGFNADGKYLAAGCTEHGTIEGNDIVDVKTSVVAAVSIGGVQVEGDAGIPVTITTPFGMALPNRPVSWRVYGSVGATPQVSQAMLATGTDEWQPSATTCAGANGSIFLRPVPPGQIGGFAARVRVSWGEEAPRQFSSFTQAEVTPVSVQGLGSTLGSSRICTARAAGAMKRLVCLEDNDPGAGVEPVARDYTVTIANGKATLTPSGMQMINEPVATVFSLQSGMNRDAYVLTSLGRVIGLFNPTRPPNAQQGSFAPEAVAEAVLVPSCGPMDPPRLFVRTIGGGRQRVWIMDPLGGTQHTPFANEFDVPLTDTVRLSAAGCVTELQIDSTTPKSRQVVVIDSDINTGGTRVSSTSAFYDCSSPSGRCSVRLPTFLSGVGFKRGDDNIEEERLVASSFDTTGTIISELIFLDTKIVERARIASAAIPDLIVSGNFDGDAKTDLVWNFAALGSTQNNFQVAYARKIDGVPLTALTGPKSIVANDMFVADVSGDANDDIILVQRARDASSSALVAVVPTRAAASPTNVRPDDQMCTP